MAERNGSPGSPCRNSRSFFPAPSWSCLLVLLILLVPSTRAISLAGNGAGYSVAGRIKFDGTHLIEVSAIGFLFSPVRVDISARNPGKIQAVLTENRRALSELILEPLGEEQYYEVREPFSIMSLVKSPMGLMMGFMLIVVFVMPKLVENMDPEEIRRAQEEMRSQGVPSLSSLLSGQAQQ